MTGALFQALSWYRDRDNELFASSTQFEEFPGLCEDISTERSDTDRSTCQWTSVKPRPRSSDIED